MTEFKQFEQLQYLIRFPEHYCDGEKYPLILLLHGAGGRGNDIRLLEENPYFQIINQYHDFPFISVAPLCSANTWFDLFEQLKRFTVSLCREPFVDTERIYLMGPSMGGYGTWQLAMSLPEIFAAIVPICGGGMYWNADRLKNVPVWAFHGTDDPIVKPEESVKMVEAVNRCGGNAKLTLYPNCAHNAWSDTYSNPELYQWLLRHTNQNTEGFQDIFHGSNLYG